MSVSISPPHEVEGDGSERLAISRESPHPLKAVQERRLVDYLEEKILQNQREYKKRNYETSSLRTLSAYLKAVQPLLTLILMIPPLDASVSLRTSLLLRLTGEILECVPGYPPDDPEELLATLDELDKGWLAVLRSQMWDATSHKGVDMFVSPDSNFKSSPISQTDRARLRSLLILATDKLEEWLEDQVPEAAEVAGVLETIDTRQRFDDLFHETLAEMGELRGSL